MVSVIKPDGQIVYANRTIIERSGTTPGDALKNRIQSFNAMTVNNERILRLQEAIRKKKAVIFEDEHDDLHFEHIITPVIDTRGDVSLLLTVSREVTARNRFIEKLRVSDIRYQELLHQKIAELEEKKENLEQTEKRFILAQEIADIGSWEWWPQNGDLFWSDQNFRLMGFQPGDIKPSHDRFLEMLHPDDRPRIEERIREVLQHDHRFTEKFRIIRPDGDIVNLAGSVLVTRDHTGQAERIFGINRNITAEKKKEEELRKSHKLLNSLMANTDDYILISDRNARPILYNDAYAGIMKTVLGIEMRPGFQPHSVLPDAEQREFWEAAHRRVLSGESFRFDYPVSLSSGESVHLEVCYRPIIGENGVEGFSEITRDITNRKTYEIELDRLMREAEQANKAKSRFLAAASHDLRQPLQVVTLFIYLLKQKTRDEEQSQIISRIEKSVSSLGKLLNTILDISRLDAGIIRPNWQAFSLETILEQLRVEFEQQLLEGDIDFKIRSSAYQVRCDKQLLETMLRNIIHNAVKYTERGRILVGCRRRGNRIAIQVYDTGVGIPEEQQETVFEEFYQLNNPSRDRSKGMGLGLSIVRRLAELLNLTLTLRSAPRRGTLFQIDVPMADTKTDTPIRSYRIDEKHSRNKLIVIIDDERDVLESLASVIGSWGHDIIAAMGQQTSREELAADGRQPDLIIADYRLADGVTGDDVIRNLQRDFNRPIPGILITGDTSPDRLIGAQNSGYHLIHKPVRAAVLQEILDEIFSD